MDLSTIVNWLNGWVWSKALIITCLSLGIYFSCRIRFAQIRHLPKFFHLVLDKKSSQTGLSSFQALAISVAGRVGVGNIAGVAAAITYGGPGALFWMWVVAFFGAGTAFVESTLAQIYKEKYNDEFRGGPAFYIEKGLKNKPLAIAFAISAMIACGFLIPGIQANAVAESLKIAFGLDVYISAVIMAVMLGFIIMGGVHRIAKFSEIIVPVMAIGYILMAIIVIIMNIGKVPEVVTLVVKSAFGADATFGALLGLAVEWGIKRGVYSNEAGMGTGAHAAAAASVSHPAKQGLVQSFSVFIDTLLVCSATGIMLIMTGKYNTLNPAVEKGFLYEGIPGIGMGSGYSQLAVETAFPGFGSAFIAIALFFFAFTSLVAFYYIAETNLIYLKRYKKLTWAAPILKVVMVIMVGYGAMKTADFAWAMGDLGCGIMAWLNIISIILLHKPAINALKDYESQVESGKEVEYDFPYMQEERQMAERNVINTEIAK